MSVRSPEMHLAGYFLSRCGLQVPNGGPPEQLGTPKWKLAYTSFYDKLGQGRTPASFGNSLKALRDTYDTWSESSMRGGWKTHTEPSGEVATTLKKWSQRSDTELWEAVRPFVSVSFD